MTESVGLGSVGWAGERKPDCELCRAAKITPWYHQDEVCWIAECDICEVPMVVWRFHGTEPPAEHLRHMQAKLRDVAAERVGEFWIDGHMRNIPDHFHAHDGWSYSGAG